MPRSIVTMNPPGSFPGMMSLANALPRAQSTPPKANLFRCLVFGELCGREFAASDVARVDLRKMLPLIGQVIQRKNRRHGADGHAGAAVYCTPRGRCNVERWPAVVVGH